MKRDCTYFELQLVDFVAGTMPTVERSRLEDHLATCESCRAELAREHELREVLGSLPLVSHPGTVGHGIPDPTKRSYTARWPVGIGLVAATLIAVVLGPSFFPGPASSPDIAPLTGLTDRGTKATTEFTAAEISQARSDVLSTLALAADIFDRSRDQAVVDIFGRQLPQAVAGSLRHRPSTANKNAPNPNPKFSGGRG